MAAPIGAIIGSTLGAAAVEVGTDLIGRAVGAIFGSSPAAQSFAETDPATGQTISAGPSVAPTFGGFGGVAVPVARAVGPPLIGAVATRLATQGQIAGPIPMVGTTAVCRPVSRSTLILQRAKQFSPGATRKKIIAAARDCGIELAAATFGLSVLDVCFLIAQRPRRRARGISAADLRRTNATIRKVKSINKKLRLR